MGILTSPPDEAVALRARIILACESGASNTEVAQSLGVYRQTVTKWRTRCLKKGIYGLLDEPRPGVPRTISDADVERVITLALEDEPDDATH